MIIHHLTPEQMADLTSVPRRTIRYRLFRIREGFLEDDPKLKELIEKQFSADMKWSGFTIDWDVHPFDALKVITEDEWKAHKFRHKHHRGVREFLYDIRAWEEKGRLEERPFHDLADTILITLQAQFGLEYGWGNFSIAWDVSFDNPLKIVSIHEFKEWMHETGWAQELPSCFTKQR